MRPLPSLTFFSPFLGAHLYMVTATVTEPVSHKHTVLGDWKDTWDPAFNFLEHTRDPTRLQELQQRDSCSHRKRRFKTWELPLRIQDLPPLWTPRCSVPREPREVSVKTKKRNVGYSEKLNVLRGNSKPSDSEFFSGELPSTVCILESLRKPGTSPHIFQQQSVETQHVKILPQLPIPNPEAEPQEV